jgi:Uma2 family endonuclease
MEGGGDMQAHPHVRRLTYDDFLLFPDDGMRHELIDGEHYVTPSPNLRHQELVGRLHFEIQLYLRQNSGRGRVFVAPLDVVFTRWDVVEPDLLFVTDDQSHILTANNVQGAPSLVVEVLSPYTRRTDQHTKRQLFDRGGVREYWVVDPDAADLTIYRRTDGGVFPMTCRLSAAAHDVLTTPLLPAFTLALDDLFA